MSQTAAGPAMLRLPASALGTLHETLSAEHSPTETALLLRRLGYGSGKAFFDAFSAWLGESADAAPVDDMPTASFWERLGEFFEQLGWGRLEHERIHPGIASISAARWAEAEQNAPSEQPACHFTTGVLAELLCRIAGTDLAVMEVQCRSRGEERCRFLIGGEEALQRIYDGMREGSSFEEALDRLG
jgi:uncharacterized protein